MRLKPRPLGNRGMSFESLIDFCNLYYLGHGIAVINKRPTPVKIMKRIGNRITGFLEKPSTVDYDGHYQQRGIAFEAKQVTAADDRLRLSNVEEHQFEYLRKSHYIGGAVSFLIVEYQNHRRTFLLPYPSLETIWIRSKAGKRGEQSIHISEMEREGFEVRSGRVPLDYLAVVDLVWDIKGAG